jgi:hypothetical protein
MPMRKKKNATRSGSFLPNSYYNIKLVLSYNFSEVLGLSG